MTDRSARFDATRSRLQRAIDNSLLVRTTRGIESTLGRWGRGSRLVQWFLAEPDPEVIVIDLRETYTVGPVLRVLDRVVAVAGRIDDRTGISDAVSRLAAIVTSAPLFALGVLLASIALGGIVTSLTSDGAIGGWLILLGLALLATRETRSAAELARTRVGKAVIAAFEPPEPPERRE